MYRCFEKTAQELGKSEAKAKGIKEQEIHEQNVKNSLMIAVSIQKF